MPAEEISQPCRLVPDNLSLEFAQSQRAKQTHTLLHAAPAVDNHRQCRGALPCFGKCKENARDSQATAVSGSQVLGSVSRKACIDTWPTQR